jgi:tetratricopeptide (TPR) repeat protein
MAKPPIPESPTQQTEDVLEDSFYEVPAELQDGAAAQTQAQPPSDDEPPAELDEASFQPKKFPVALVSGAALAVICIVGGLVAYRCHGQRKVVAEGLRHAEQLMMLDTAESYRKAADLLAPLAKLDPLEAGSMRAFALSMLACDYRDAQAEEEANRLLVVPGRADPMPRYASLAFRALALGRDALADAALERGGPEEAAADGHAAAEIPWGRMLSARVDLSAGSYESAIEYAGAAAATPGFAAGLAVHGDAFRRARRDYRTALSSYEAALAASPANPRAAFGLAKLALAGQAPEAEARAALDRVLGSPATPYRARGHAALHLAALRIRAGDPLDAVRRDVGAQLGAGLPAKELDWLMGAARAEAANKGPYKAVFDQPDALKTKTDDDLEDKGFRALSPEPPPPPPPPPAVEPPPPPKAAPHAAKGAKAHVAPAKAAKGAKPGKAAKAAPAKAGAKAAASKKSASAASKATAKKKAKKTR